MKIGIFGKGKMGRIVEEEALKLGYCIVEPSLADACIDFSHADLVFPHIEWAIENRKPLVIGTTGWDARYEEAKKRLAATEDTAILVSPNFSLSVALFIQLLKRAQALFADYDLAGVEFHHREKKDTPSGTAQKIASELNMKHPFASVRCGQITGKHLLIFDSPSDSITLIHEAHHRRSFALGALRAAVWVIGKKGWYTFDEMLRDLYGSHYAI